MDEQKSHARIAFEAYSESTGGKTWDGKPIPPFDALPDGVKAAWEAAASAIAPKSSDIWRELLDERQLKELDLATLYARDFHHGTTGHNQLMLIAKLAEILDRQPDSE